MATVLESFRLREVAGISSDAAPIRVGLPLARGVALPGSFALELDGVPVDAAITTSATWDDGSVAHAIASFVAPVAAYGGHRLDVVDGRRKLRRAFALHDLPWNALRFRVEVEDASGTVWTCALEDDDVALDALLAVVNGGGTSPVARQLEAELPLVAGLGVEHPALRCRVLARVFARCPSAWLRVMVENCNVGRGVARVDVVRTRVRIGDRELAGPGAGPHLPGQRWRRSSWVGTPAPRVELLLSSAQAWRLALAPPLTADGCDPVEAAAFATKLRKEAGVAGKFARGIGSATAFDPDGGPLDPFPIYKRMGGTGDRHDIGPVPTWSLAFLQGGEPAVLDLQRWADVNGSGAFPIHWRQSEGVPLHLPPGAAPWGGRLPPFGLGSNDPEPNVAHLPRLGLLSWLCAADEDAADELAAWACLAVRDNYPNDGTLQNMGDRREAWALYTLAAAARFLPDDHPTRALAQSCLERTAAEWNARLPGLVAAQPLGNLNPGASRPSGRDWSKFTRVVSPWMQAWFVAGCVVADELLGRPLFRPIAEAGWRWFEHYVDPPAFFGAPGSTPASFDPSDDATLPPDRASLAALVSYSVPVATYVPTWSAKAGWGETPGSVKALATMAAVRWWQTLTAENSGYPLTEADLPADPDPDHVLPAKVGADGVTREWTPVAGEDYHAYGPGRVGLPQLARRAALRNADAVLAALAPRVARGAASRPSWANLDWS